MMNPCQCGCGKLSVSAYYRGHNPASHKGRKRQLVCLNGHARTPENVTQAGNCRTCAATGKQGYWKDRLAYKRKWHAELKAETFQAYGGVCACCGESNLALLSIDFVLGGGHKHHRKFSGEMFYLELRRRNWPRVFEEQPIQVLCLGCNSGKRTGTCCPHQRSPEAQQQILLDSAKRLKEAGWLVFEPPAPQLEEADATLCTAN